MNKLDQFKAFELGKAQMNAIAGGKVICYIHAGDMDIEVTEVAPGIGPNEAGDILKSTYPWADSFTCTTIPS